MITRKPLAAAPEMTCSGRRRDCPCRKCFLERKRYRVEYEHGRRRTTAADPIRRHIEQLAAAGVGRGTIAAHVGVDPTTLLRITMGQVANVHLDTAEKILAVTPSVADRVPNNRLVDAMATLKRIRALRALGYSTDWIAEHCGQRKYLEIKGHQVTRQRALAILGLCKEIGETPGPCAKAAGYARKRGWRRPHEFDEDLFYELGWDGSEPDVAEECRAIQLTSEYDHLKSFHWTDETAAERLGISESYLRSLLSKRSRRVFPFGPVTDDGERMVG